MPSLAFIHVDAELGLGGWASGVRTGMLCLGNQMKDRTISVQKGTAESSICTRE